MESLLGFVMLLLWITLSLIVTIEFYHNCSAVSGNCREVLNREHSLFQRLSITQGAEWRNVDACLISQELHGCQRGLHC